MAEPQILIQNEGFLRALSAKIKQKHQIPNSKELEDVKASWYQATLVHSTMEEICDELDVDTPAASNSDNKEIIESLRERFVLAGCEQLLEANESCSLLGIQAPQKSAPMSEDDLAELGRIINQKMKSKLLALAQFYLPSPPTAGSRLLCAKASQLDKLIEKDITALEMTKNESVKLKYERLLQMRKLHKVYSDNIQKFKILLDQCKVRDLPRHELSTTHQITAKTEALCAKIGSIEHEVLADIYKPEMVKELSIARSSINTKLKESQENLKRAEMEYQSCLSAGSEFKIIANEYSQLRKAIEARTWALHELQTAKNHKTV